MGGAWWLGAVVPHKTIEQLQAQAIMKREQHALVDHGAGRGVRKKNILAKVQADTSAWNQVLHDGFQTGNDEVRVVGFPGVAIGARDRKAIGRAGNAKGNRGIESLEGVDAVAPDGDAQACRERDKAHARQSTMKAAPC